MVVRFLDIVSYHIFKGEHTINIEVSCAGDQVLLICILAGQLIADEMAAIIEVLSIHTIVLDCVPSSWFYLANTARVPL